MEEQNSSVAAEPDLKYSTPIASYSSVGQVQMSAVDNKTRCGTFSSSAVEKNIYVVSHETSCISRRGRLLEDEFCASSYRLPKLNTKSGHSSDSSDLNKYFHLYTCDQCNATYVYKSKNPLDHVLHRWDILLQEVVSGRDISLQPGAMCRCQTPLHGQNRPDGALHVARLTLPDIHKANVYRDLRYMEELVVNKYCKFLS